MTEITMPKLSDTMTEGQLGVWLKSVGDRIEKGDIIAEVETDKATMELEAFASGVLLERFVEAGQMVSVGSVIGIIGEPDEAVSAKDKTVQSPTPPAKAETPPIAQPGEASSEAKREVPPPQEAMHHDERSAPVVRRRAQELGIDIADVTGSGPGGRVLLEDLEAFAHKQVEDRRKPKHHPAEVKAPEKHKAVEHPVKQAVAKTGKDVEIVPQTRMRSAIARTVTESWKSIPHFFITTDIRMDTAEEIRRELKENGIDVSYDDMIVKSATLAIHKYPLVNASFVDEGIKLNQDMNIGVMTKTEEGLFAPVVKRAQLLSLREIADTLQTLIEKAKNSTISPADLSEGTFSISNLGMYDVSQFTAIIPPPQAAILAIGKAADVMVVENGQPLVARVMTVTMSADHRVFDGAYAAGFLRELKHILENPAQLLLC